MIVSRYRRLLSAGQPDFEPGDFVHRIGFATVYWIDRIDGDYATIVRDIDRREIVRLTWLKRAKSSGDEYDRRTRDAS